jgi:hypothetical protein
MKKSDHHRPMVGRRPLLDIYVRRKEVISVWDDFDWMDLALAGSMAEEMSEEEMERIRLEREMQDDDTEPCCCDDDPYA